jgi:hypothetical protein
MKKRRSVDITQLKFAKDVIMTLMCFVVFLIAMLLIDELSSYVQDARAERILAPETFEAFGEEWVPVHD